MSLYISQRFHFDQRKIWIPGDPGLPTSADTKQELLPWRPTPPPCPATECNRKCIIQPVLHHKSGYWRWQHRYLCDRCKFLRYSHGLELTDLIAIWEKQNRQCFQCSRTLIDPRLNVSRKRADTIKIDHDHMICPRKVHSCERCRRGLACCSCNVNELAIKKAGFWILPEDDKDLSRWLEFIGPEGCNRLRKML